MISRNSKSGIICVPSVVKVSERAYAEQELENYHRFVKWGLPYTWRVDLLGHGMSKGYGAIAYSFILSDLKKFGRTHRASPAARRMPAPWESLTRSSAPRCVVGTATR